MILLSFNIIDSHLHFSTDTLQPKLEHCFFLCFFFLTEGDYLCVIHYLNGGVVAQLVGGVTPGDEVPGFDSLLWPPAPYWLGRCQYVTG